MGKVVWIRPQSAMLNTKEINLREKIEKYIKEESFNSNDPRCCAAYILQLAKEVFHGNERFPIYELAKILGFKVYRADMDKMNIEGYIYLDPKITDDAKSRTIVVNRSNREGHQRFTVAHELWHYFIWLHKDASLKTVLLKQESNAITQDLEEINASAFAAELLMPEDEFRQILKRYNDIMPNTTNLRLMSYFGVTETAVLRRRRDLRN